MVRSIRLRLLALLALSGFPSFAWAWNDTGHMTVALIAYRQFDEVQKQKVATILRSHPHFTEYLGASVPDGVTVDEWAFLRGAVWSDWIRPATPGRMLELYKGPEVTRFSRPEWHYIKLPWVPPFERDRTNATTLPARTEPNAQTAFDENSKILGDADAKIEDRAVALTWLEHIVGDIHQPLHACDFWSSSYPTGDKGGGEQAVRVNGEPIRLHVFWDSALGTSNAHQAVTFVADEILNDPRLGPDRLVELKTATTFGSWVDESHAWAISMVYLNGRLKSAPWPALDAKQIAASDVPALPASYLGNARELSKRRVALAGLRLAEQLKRLLKD